MLAGEKIIVGRLGEQPMLITDSTVAPQHMSLLKIDEETYQIEDLDSPYGTFVFGLRIKRKKVKPETPLLLGNFQVTVHNLLLGQETLRPLQQVWDEYNSEKLKLTNKVTRASRIPMFVSLGVGAISSPIVACTNSLGISSGLAALIPIVLMGIAYIIAMKYGENVTAEREERMQILNAKFQKEYICPRCYKFLGFTSYDILRANGYCPYCKNPLLH